ncbi:hypothetical protein KUCAC02_036263 [Chaenocephalus aceratus]|nr:hypothetical protein KUCAC02_036263 [Chaenocephalus aceratus]
MSPGEVGGACPGEGGGAWSFLLQQSYLCALMAMMLWPVSYVSWLTCVLLLWSCLLWMLKERRRYTMMSSPWLVAYGNLLVLLQYIYSFPPAQEVPGLFPRKQDPCRELASKVPILLLIYTTNTTTYVLMCTLCTLCCCVDVYSVYSVLMCTLC